MSSIPNTVRYDIFLSYNHADRDWVRSLAVRIEKETFNDKPIRVFFDEWRITPGDNIPLALEEGIRSSRKIGIVISPDAIQSSWVRLERSVAHALDPAGRHKRIIPIFLRGSESDLPPLLVPLQYVDFRDPDRFDNAFSCLITAIQSDPDVDSKSHEKLEHSQVPEIIRQTLLEDSGRLCAICHSSVDVDIYPIDINRPRRNRASDLISLCPSCHYRARHEEMSPEHLSLLRGSWLDMHSAGMSVKGAAQGIKALYDEANRLSLTAKDVWDIRRAKVLCQEILCRYNPFHADTRILFEKLVSVEQKMAAGELLFHTHLIATPFQRLIVLGLTGLAIGLGIYQKTKNPALSILTVAMFVALGFIKALSPLICFLITLPHILIHETGHIVAIYLVQPVRNAYGKRMSFFRYFKYLEVGEKPFWEGTKDLLRGRFKSEEVFTVSVNFSKMIEEWFETVNPAMPRRLDNRRSRDRQRK